MNLQEVQKNCTPCSSCGSDNLDATESVGYRYDAQDQSIREVSIPMFHVRCNNCKTILFEGPGT